MKKISSVHLACLQAMSFFALGAVSLPGLAQADSPGNLLKNLQGIIDAASAPVVKPQAPASVVNPSIKTTTGEPLEVPHSLRGNTAHPTLDNSEIVISASRTEQRVQDALAVTTLITRVDIDKAQTSDLIALLRQVGGVETNQSGGRGTMGAVSIRGSGSTQVLVLIDGVPVNNLVAGSADVANIPLANVDHIEIVRGNVAALYGSAALGGVIQIFTKESAKGEYASVNTQIGSGGYALLSASAAKILASKTRISASAESVSDTDVTAANAASPLWAGSTPGQNLDGYKRRTLSLGLSHDIDQGAIGLRFRSVMGRVGFPGFNDISASSNDVMATKSQAITVEGKYQLSSQLSAQAAITRSVDDGNSDVNYIGGNYSALNGFANVGTTRLTTGLDWKFAIDQLLSVGFESSVQSLSASTGADFGAGNTYAVSQRKNNSSRLAYLLSKNDYQIQVGLRRDSYSDFGSADTWLLSGGYRLNEHWRLNASASTGFNAPSFALMYYPGYENPNLKPEQLRSNEAGIQYANKWNEWRLVRFENSYTNLIASNAPRYIPYNVGLASIQGWEYSQKSKINDTTTMTSGYTLQNPIDTWTGQVLSRRAKTLANWGASTKAYGMYVGFNYRYTGKVMDGTNSLGGYGLLDLTAAYPINKQGKVNVRLDNALNKSYESVYGYNQPLRRLYLGLNWAL